MIHYVQHISLRIRISVYNYAFGQPDGFFSDFLISI